MKRLSIVTVIIIALVASLGGVAIGAEGLRTVKLLMNGQEITPPAPAVLIDGNTYVPLRFVADILGANVEWDEKENTAKITYDTSQATAQDWKKATYKVTAVTDGDTIEVLMNGKAEKVRLIGVDTPETVHPTKEVQAYGKEASDYAKVQLNGKMVNLELDVQDRDRYGRLLAYVWVGEVMFNEKLVAEGYAQVSTYPPNVKYVDKFVAAQTKARNAKKGLWSLPESVRQPAPSTPAATTGKYVGSKDSDKYHTPACQWAKKITTENLVWFQTADEAKKIGYQPCGVCKPQ